MDAESHTIEGMLAAGARALEVQRYLRLTELARAGRSLHAAEVRHSIALMLYSAARHVVDEGVE